MFAPVAHAQVLRKIVYWSIDGFACGIVADVSFQQLHIDGIRRVVVLLSALLKREMVHLNGINFHGNDVSIETGRHALRHCRLAAAGRSRHANNENIPWTRSANHKEVYFRIRKDQGYCLLGGGATSWTDDTRSDSQSGCSGPQRAMPPTLRSEAAVGAEGHHPSASAEIHVTVPIRRPKLTLNQFETLGIHMTHKAKDLSPDQKMAIESLLGRSMAKNEEISIRTFRNGRGRIHRKQFRHIDLLRTLPNQHVVPSQNL